jgi:hypothetical protein
MTRSAPRKLRAESTRDAVETAIDLSKSGGGTWEARSRELKERVPRWITEVAEDSATDGKTPDRPNSGSP